MAVLASTAILLSMNTPELVNAFAHSTSRRLGRGEFVTPAVASTCTGCGSGRDSGRVGGEPDVVIGQPLVKPQPGGRQIGPQFLLADPVAGPRVRPHPVADVVGDHDVPPPARLGGPIGRPVGSRRARLQTARP